MTIFNHAEKARAKRQLSVLLLATGVATLSACSSSNNNDTNGNVIGGNTDGYFAYALTRAGYESSRIDRISVEDLTVKDSYPAQSATDYSLDTDGDDLYVIGKFQLDTVTRYDDTNTSTPDYQVSVLNTDEENILTANPYSLAFASDNKAYLTRYGSTKLWVVNPDADVNEGETFKFSEIDLSAYNTPNLPRMSDALVLDNKLFVLMEMLSDAFVPENFGYIAVFNIGTDQEIETNQGISPLKGIQLNVKNPTSLHYNDITKEIYVVGRGHNFASGDDVATSFTGGIEAIDPTTYQHQLLLDDGTADENTGYFTDAEVINGDLGFLLTYASFGSATLRTFNPTTGILNEGAVAGLEDIDITEIKQGPNNHLWIGINDDTPGFERLNLSTMTLAEERIRTEFIPSDLVFIDTTDDE